MFFRRLGHSGELFQGENPAASRVVGVFEAEQARPREVNVPGPHGGANGFGVEDTVLAREGTELDAGEHRGGTGLVDEDMGALMQEYLFSPVRVYLDPDLVGHRPRRRVQSRLLAEQVGHVLLQPVYGRVLPEDVVANRRLQHRPPHSFRRTGHCVAAKIYHGLPPLCCSSTRRVVAKWVLATPARPPSPNSSTTRRPASTTCVAPRGSRKPTRSERCSISSSCRARASMDAAATAASSSARGRTSSRTLPGTNGSR